MNEAAPKPPVKVRLATTSLAGCFGCHMSILDIDEHISSSPASPNSTARL